MRGYAVILKGGQNHFPSGPDRSAGEDLFELFVFRKEPR